MARASGATAFQKSWSTETFMGPAHWMNSMVQTDPSQSNTSAWFEASHYLLPNSTYLGTGFISAGLNSTRCMLDVHNAALGTSWWLIGASSSDVTGGQEKILPGARTLGFYVLTSSSTPRLVFDIEGDNQWGEAITERVTLTQRSHSGLVLGEPTPVSAAFYDPNSLGVGGGASATWCWLPVIRGLQTVNAYSKPRRITLRERHSTTNGDRVGVHIKTLQFGLRSEVRSILDVVGGYVKSYMTHPGPEGAWANIPAAGAGPFLVNAQFGPFLASLKLAYASINDEYNLLQLDNTVAGRNLHVPRTTNISTQFIEMNGDLIMMANQPWELVVETRHI